MPCGSCGGARRSERRGAPAVPSSNSTPDLTAAALAGAKPRYLVLANQAASAATGKAFTTFHEAQQYASRTRGIVRVV